MKTNVLRSLAIVLTLAAIGYLAISLQPANAAQQQQQQQQGGGMGGCCS